MVDYLKLNVQTIHFAKPDKSMHSSYSSQRDLLQGAVYTDNADERCQERENNVLFKKAFVSSQSCKGKASVINHFQMGKSKGGQSESVMC